MLKELNLTKKKATADETWAVHPYTKYRSLQSKLPNVHCRKKKMAKVNSKRQSHNELIQ